MKKIVTTFKEKRTTYIDDKILSKEEVLIKEIFEMVYGWGNWHIKVDDSAPAYRKTIQQLKRVILKGGDSYAKHTNKKRIRS